MYGCNMITLSFFFHFDFIPITFVRLLVRYRLPLRYVSSLTRGFHVYF